VLFLIFSANYAQGLSTRKALYRFICPNIMVLNHSIVNFVQLLSVKKVRKHTLLQC